MELKRQVTIYSTGGDFPGMAPDFLQMGKQYVSESAYAAAVWMYAYYRWNNDGEPIRVRGQMIDEYNMHIGIELGNQDLALYTVPVCSSPEETQCLLQKMSLFGFENELH